MALTGRELIAKLSKASLGAKLAVLGAACAALFGLYYYFFYSVMLSEETQLNLHVDQASREEKALQARKQQYVQLVTEKNQLEQELRKNQVKLPTQAELPAFFKHLQVQAGAANVDLINWSNEPERAVGGYFKVPVKMEVRGNFYQLNHYFKLLYETQRIITVEDLNISSPKIENEELLLKATFVAATFRQEPVAPGAVPPGGAPGGR